MPFINYGNLRFRLQKHDLGKQEWFLEVKTNFNVDPVSKKTSATYERVEHPSFVSAVLLWIKNGQKFADMEMHDFINTLLTPDEIAQLNGMPVATQTNEIREK